MHLIPIDVSLRQLSKLKKGHPVRVKKGTGFNLIVSPSNYRIATRAFTKNKGLEIKLSPEEIEANRSLSPEQHAQYLSSAKSDLNALLGATPFAGKGIFDDIISHPITKEIYREVAPELKEVAKDYLKESLRKGSGLRNLHNQTIGNLVANSLGTTIDDGQFLAKHLVEPIRTRFDDPLAPRSRGSGMSHHIPSHARFGLISGKGVKSFDDSILPPALRSQPYGVNWNMQYMLPPQYQKFNSGGEDIGSDHHMTGHGLYA